MSDLVLEFADFMIKSCSLLKKKGATDPQIKKAFRHICQEGFGGHEGLMEVGRRVDHCEILATALRDVVEVLERGMGGPDIGAFNRARAALAEYDAS